MCQQYPDIFLLLIVSASQNLLSVFSYYLSFSKCFLITFSTIFKILNLLLIFLQGFDIRFWLFDFSVYRSMEINYIMIKYDVFFHFLFSSRRDSRLLIFGPKFYLYKPNTRLCTDIFLPLGYPRVAGTAVKTVRISRVNFAVPKHTVWMSLEYM